MSHMIDQKWDGQVNTKTKTKTNHNFLKMVFPLVTGLFFNAIWLVVRRVFAMLRTVNLEQLREANLRIVNLERQQLEDTNLEDTNLEDTNLEDINLEDTDIDQQPISPPDLIALTVRLSSTEEEL